MLKKWNVLKSEIVLKTPWFQIRRDCCKTTEGVIVPEYYTWEKKDCVIVFPVTSDNNALLIKQYRHGVQRVCVDYPGGTIEEGQSLVDAAKAELLEETGFGLENCYEIGSYAMDSSYSNQLTHFVIATGCTKISEPCNPQEVTQVIKVPISKLSTFAEKEIDCLLCSLLTLKGLDYLSRKGEFENLVKTIDKFNLREFGGAI